MTCPRFMLFGLLWSISIIYVYSQTIRDTVYTTDKDRIIVCYDITHSNDTYTISFHNDIRRKLGTINSEKYEDLSKIGVMFFDRTGNYNKNVSISGMVPESVMIPSGVQYNHSSEGYFVIQDSPILIFKTAGKAAIDIPLYLAHHPKKGKYTLFSKCQDLHIKLVPNDNSIKSSSATRTMQQVVTSTSETEADNTELIKTVESINLAQRLIEEADKLPFSESLLDEINYLRQQKRNLTENEVLSGITDILNKYEDKKRLLEEKASAEQLAIQQQAEEKARQEAATIQAQNDSIAAAKQLQAEKAQKRSMWMIIGGVTLAVFGFIGNQIFQHFRNIHNQRNMMEMQQSIANQAEREAKRRVRNATRATSSRMANDIKTKASEAANKKAPQKINGKNKNLSI